MMKIVYVIAILAVLGLVTTATMQESVYAHTLAWRYGYEQGQSYGRVGSDADSPCSDYWGSNETIPFHHHSLNLTTVDSINRCEAGFKAGWVSTCALALTNPNTEHDIYGCPGISNKVINQIINNEPKPVINETECAIREGPAVPFAA